VTLSPNLKIVRIRLSGSKSNPGIPQSDVSLPEGGLIVIVGPNGSGKSLLATSIAVALCEHIDHETAENLYSAGLENIELVCEYDSRVG
jgi:predicted ATP-binding protein involved in virulence